MRIGIDASRAFQKERTGIEEYSYQVIFHLREFLAEAEVILYTRPRENPDFSLPKNWKVKPLYAPRFWTQFRLSWELFFHPVDKLLVLAHVLPIVHPKNTLVVVHGLEYEILPKAYSFWDYWYMRLSIKKSCHWAIKIIAVSENTKKDLINLYKISAEKIQVIYEGYSSCHCGLNPKSTQKELLDSRLRGNDNSKGGGFMFFIGRLEERKNILGIIKAFEILKEKYKISHQLVLAGKKGFGYEKIEDAIKDSKYKADIILLGFVDAQEKWRLLSQTDVFMFPSLYEGFGLPILEAQSVGTPVVTSNLSSMPEVAGESAILVDPNDPEAIAEETYKLISDENLHSEIVAKGYANIKRFDWKKCAEEIVEIL